MISPFDCHHGTADIEFGFTLSQAINKGNNLAHYLIQSFDPGETTLEQANEIGKQLADIVTKGQYEYVLTIHIDKRYIHKITSCFAPLISLTTNGLSIVKPRNQVEHTDKSDEWHTLLPKVRN